MNNATETPAVTPVIVMDAIDELFQKIDAQPGGITVYVHRLSDDGSRPFLRSYVGSAFDLEAVQRDCGGGRYQAVAKRRGKYVAAATFEVDDAPAGSAPAAAPASPGLAAAPAPAAPAAVDPFGMMEKMVGMFGAMMAAVNSAPRPEALSIKDVLPLLQQKQSPAGEVLGLVRELDAMRGGTPNVHQESASDVLAELIRNGPQIIAALRPAPATALAAPRAKAPEAKADVVAKSGPADAPAAPDDSRRLLAVIHAAAAAGFTPHAAATMTAAAINDIGGDDYWAQIEAMPVGTLAAGLAQVPELAGRQVWLEELETLVRKVGRGEDIDEGNAPDEAPASKA